MTSDNDVNFFFAQICFPPALVPKDSTILLLDLQCMFSCILFSLVRNINLSCLTFEATPGEEKVLSNYLQQPCNGWQNSIMSVEVDMDVHHH